MISNMNMWHTGDAVLVKESGYKYSNKIGIVTKVSGTAAYVSFGSVGSSCYRYDRLEEWDLPVDEMLLGYLLIYKKRVYDAYFKRKNKKNENENKRSENKMTNLEKFNKIAVITIGYKEYSFALYDEDVKEGDTVIVTGMASDKILTVDKIIDVTENTEVNKITAEVKGKVDLTAYNERVEKRQRKAELMKKMDKAIAQADELDKYAKYAEFLGDDFKAMLDEFKSL